MPSLERFERLVSTTVALRKADLHHIGQFGELTDIWIESLPRLPRPEQLAQTKTVLTEMIISDITDEQRLSILSKLFVVVERLVGQMQADYIHNPQSSHDEQETRIFEVRSLYFLLILCYQGIAQRAHTQLTQDESKQNAKNAKPTQTGWLSKLTEKLSGNVVQQGAGLSVAVITPQKRLFTLAVYHMMGVYFKLLLEFALTYQKVPAFIWGLMNGWYLKAAKQSVEHTDINKLHNALTGTIAHQYSQSCLANFANLFAYRRSDIINIFKVLPTWVKYTQATFTAHPHYKVFVNLQAPTPPEFITPYATVNPYSSENVCLFFDVTDLFLHLKTLEKSEDSSIQFESRMAKIVLLAFARQLESQTSTTRINEHLARMVTGFFAIFDELSGGKKLPELINHQELPEKYQPRTANRAIIGSKEVVKVLTKSDASIQFVFGDIDARKPVDMASMHISVFGLFALKSDQSTHQNPWRLGMIHWAEPTDNQVAVDGKFFGRILSVCGVRLRSSAGDNRPQDFIHAILVSGDGFNHQITLIMPRYHFKAGDSVILRVESKESTLRLTRHLLTTDDFEQYEVVRLV